MNHQVFVPVTDEIIYNHPEQIEGPLIPYSAGMECHDWLAIEINPDESLVLGRSAAIEKPTKRSLRRTSKLHLAYSS
ncbi:MAG: hypothetical protein ACI9FR_001810 [Cryomorphaceae bacterium]|jgi:hypothetical protein